MAAIIAAMGAGLGKLLDALSCADCARYVFNSMHCESVCCTKDESCCRMKLDTDMVELAKERSERSEELELETDCCRLHEHH
jgi:hypothetical protein